MPTDLLGFVHHYNAPRPDAPPIVLLLLHGTGGSETDLIDLGTGLAPGVAMLSPRGRVSENGQARFFRRLAPGVFDEEDVKLRAQELADFIDAAADAYVFDRTKVVAVGFSNGANMAASMLLLHPDKLAGAILFRPQVPLTVQDRPDLTDVPVLISASRNDQMVPETQPEELANLLVEFGAKVTVNWETSGHQLNASEIDTASQWLLEHWPAGTALDVTAEAES